MNHIHKSLSSESWSKMTLAEQLGNVGSEVDRIVRWQEKGNKEQAQGAFYRAVDLLNLTISDLRWRGPRLKELARLHEVLCDSFFRSNKIQLGFLQKYFYNFAFLARKHN